MWAVSGVLRVIDLQQCYLLTDAIIPVIIECIPDLTDFHELLTGITKEGILLLAASLIPKRLRILSQSSLANRKWLLESLEELKLLKKALRILR